MRYFGRPRCKYCRHPLDPSSIIRNTVICKHCYSSYPILQTRGSSIVLTILLVFTLTFAGYLLWSKGFINQWGQLLSDGYSRASHISAQ